jgi:hypothetical protein
MARINFIRGTTLPNSTTKEDCHDLVDDAVAVIYDINNSEIKSDAAIKDTKLANIFRSGKVNLTALSIVGQTEGDILYRKNYDDYTKLLCTFKGADGATTFTAETGQTVTFVGTAQIDNAQSKFGGTSLLLNGTTDYATLPDNDNWYFGTGDFTIDCWVRWNTLPVGGSQKMFSQYQDMNNRFQLQVSEASGVYTLRFTHYPNNATADIDFSKVSSGLVVNTWYHIAVVRSGNSWYIFQDGVQQGTTETNANSILDNTGLLYIGCRGDVTGLINGWIDEFRISKGIARWTANFTPPASQDYSAFARLPIGAAGQVLKVYNTQVDYFAYTTDLLAQTAYVTNAIGTGGAITKDGNTVIHKFTSSGNFTPAHTGTVKVQAWGGGGAGRQRSGNGQGGGGGGAYAETPNVAVTATTVYPVVVGDGGLNDNTTPATKSTFNTNVVVADFGLCPATATRIGALGGLVANCTGTTKFKGGDGGDGNDGNDSGGGGGGAAGPDGAGLDGADTSSGTGGDGGTADAGLGGLGGIGGPSGGTRHGLPGADNLDLGGGGGGGGGGTSSGEGADGGDFGGGGGGGEDASGNGGKGGVIISYTCPLQCFSESTIKSQGSYSLKCLAQITTSLNKTLTRTVSPVINLTDKNTLNFDIRASRTGSNIKIGIHDSGGTTTENTPNILVADTWQTISWDISGVANANKDAINSIIITVLNADVENTFYLDNFYTGDGVTVLKWEAP